jgi:pimeloyl-ACP methyl ester carboxylesterase
MAAVAPEHVFIDVGGLRLHVVQAGPSHGKAVIFLHGFPDFWIGSRQQIEALASAGFRVIAPDQRGYNLTDKPGGTRQYTIEKLVNDVAGLGDALGLERFHLVGHDWGGIVAWSFAASRPTRLEKLVILNAPHPEAIVPYALRSPLQLLRSSYVGFFQIPWLPEAVLSAQRFAALVRALVGSSRPGAFAPQEFAEYREAWGKPGALTAMLNWYRALPYRPTLEQQITAPTLVLWGERDEFLETGLAEKSLSFCRDGRLQTFADATHWLQREEALAVNSALVSFLGT